MQQTFVVHRRGGSTGHSKLYPSARAPAVNRQRRAYFPSSFSHSEQAPVAALSARRERLVTNADSVSPQPKSKERSRKLSCGAEDFPNKPVNDRLQRGQLPKTKCRDECPSQGLRKTVRKEALKFGLGSWV